MADDEKREIHDSILKDHEKRIFALETNQKEIMSNQNDMGEKLDDVRTTIKVVKGQNDTIISMIQNPDGLKLMKWGVGGGAVIVIVAELLIKLPEIIHALGGM